MKRRFVVLCLMSFVFLSMLSATVIPISTIQDNINDYIDQIVTIEGVVTVGANLLSTSVLEAYIQDDSGKGLRIHDVSITTAYASDIIKGNKLQITGKIISMAGYTRISEFTYTVLETSVERPFTELTLPQANDYSVWQGTFAKISGTLISHELLGGHRLVLRDSQENEILIQVVNSTGIIVSNPEIGHQMTVYGVVKFLSNQSLIYPAYQNDLGLTITHPVISNISHTPNEPYNDENIIVTARVIDYDGQLTQVSVKYRTNSMDSFIDLPMSLTSDNVYQAELPPFNTYSSQTGNFVYKIFAKDNDQNVSESTEMLINIRTRPVIVPISDIYQNISSYLGQNVIIEGVITIGAGTIHNSILRAYIQDESKRGLQIFAPGASAYINDLAKGNRVRMSGLVGEYQGVIQISNFTYEVLGSEAVPYIEMTIAEAQNYQAWESSFVKISGALYEMPFYAGGGHNINIKDVQGSTITVRVWDTTQIDVSRLKTGVPLDAYGIVSVFNNRSQIVPGDSNDLVILITNPQIEEITFNPENPFVDETVTVSASIIDFDGTITSAYLDYRTNEEADFSVEKRLNMTAGNNNIYTAVLPAFETYSNDEGEYLVRITATDNENNVTVSQIKKVDVMKRRPVITNIRFMNKPGINDSLIVRADISDTDGYIAEAVLLYSLNFSSTKYEVQMNEISNNNGSHVFEALIPGQPSGTIVYVSVWAVDDSGLTSLKEFDNNGDEIKYVYPVLELSAILKIKPKAYNIYSGDKIEIGYFAKTGDKVIMRIYNSEGKLMATPVNRIVSSPEGINFYNWDGRDKVFRLVEPGLYICHLEVIDRDSGKKKSNKAPIVIGMKLK